MQTRSMSRYFIALLVLLSFGLSLWAQDDDQSKAKKKSKFDPNPAVLIVPYYTAQLPFGNMADRFGFNSLFGAQLSYKTKRNWLIGGEGGFIYGQKVKENYILDNITTTTGQMITQYNDLTYVKLEEHGFSIKFNFGKVIPFVVQYPDAGLLLMTGFGFLQHKISLNVKATELPQLSTIYKRGYDRLTNGPVISQFIGATFMARRKYFSGYAGLQFDAAFTQGRRPYDFYLGEPLHDKRVDMFLGFKIGYIIPVFLQASAKEYYYY